LILSKRNGVFLTFLVNSLIQTPPNTLLHPTAQIQAVPRVPTLLIGISLR